MGRYATTLMLALDSLPGAVWQGVALVFGLIVGSFANVCIHRIPRRESVVWPRSYCPRCGDAIPAWANLPLVSYLALLGRCRRCRGRISPRYPAVELANGLFYWALAGRGRPVPETLVLMFFVTALLILSLIDLEHFILPDVITLPGIGLGLLASLLPGPPGPLASALSALSGYLAFFALAEAYRRGRGIEALGQGDWKMAALLGAFLGWQKMLLTIFLASLAGAVVGFALIALRRRSATDKVPFGTFLGLAGILVVFVGDPLVRWYRGLFGG
jgi:leader peptidase (prepilin peptidase) / N-methyltransferase